jgi:hypothetical protein
MKLYDFKQDDKLNNLRDLMGADTLGHFELFDPVRHLSWQERKALNGEWINVTTSSLHAYSDHTLAYKNSHVFSVTEKSFHFSFCDDLKKRINQGKLANAQVTLNDALLEGRSVCEYCLHAVSYQGYDAYRRRHEEYNQRIIKKFKFSDYLQGKYKSTS